MVQRASEHYPALLQTLSFLQNMSCYESIQRLLELNIQVFGAYEQLYGHVNLILQIVGLLCATQIINQNPGNGCGGMNSIFLTKRMKELRQKYNEPSPYCSWLLILNDHSHMYTNKSCIHILQFPQLLAMLLRLAVRINSVFVSIKWQIVLHKLDSMV